MKYFLLCALLISGAFFSANAQVLVDGRFGTNLDICPIGNYSSELGFCWVPATTKDIYDCFVDGVNKGKVTELAACLSYASSSVNNRISQRDPSTICSQTSPETIVNSPSSATYRIGISGFFVNGSCRSPLYDSSTATLLNPTSVYECPPESSNENFYVFNQGPYVTEEGYNICFHPAQPQPECDCANYAGDSLTSYNSLVAPVGQYTRENPPQCVQQREWTVGRDDPLTCVCQVSAQKWISSLAGSKDGVEYERWETLPTQIGQPSGTFTGVKCSDKDGGTQKPEDDAPKECFTTKNGLKWCWADKNEKCQIVNGVEQCVSGCGTVNGDFVCYEDTPVIPPRDKEDPIPPDDTITNPEKSINDMSKGDFKEVNKGVEQRLDNVVIAVNNSAVSMDNVSDQVGLTNSKLDGVGRQLDGIGKQIGDIDGTLDGIADDTGDIKDVLEGAFGKGGKGGKGKGMPGLGAGDCVADCSWYESAYPDGIVGIWQEHSAALKQTPVFTFLDQFKFEPDGAQPDFQLCFNMGKLGDYGCKSLEVPSVIWAFMKLVILISAAFLCRALIFGG